jgi:hypothetical protein
MRKIIAAVILLLLNGPSGAENGLVAITSSHPTIEKGAIIKRTQVIELHSGESLKLLSAAGKVFQLQGPYNGVIKLDSKSNNDSTLKSVSELLKNTKSTDFTLAIFRNTSVATPGYRPDIWGVDIRKSGRYCLRTDLPIYLWWPQASSGALITLADTTNSQSVEMEWPAREKYTKWPEVLPVDDRVIYSVKNNKSPGVSEFVIEPLPTKLKSDMEFVAWMSDHDCRKQAIRLLGEIISKSQ